MEKKYKTYTVDELLQDDYFISSILHPTQESREFWDFLIQSGNLSAQDFEEAAFFIEVVHSPKEKLLRKEKEALWSKIDMYDKYGITASCNCKDHLGRSMCFHFAGRIILFLL